MFKKATHSVALSLLVATLVFAQEIVPGPIQTPWDAKVDPASLLPEYPRPQLVRKTWQNLNGKWDYALTSKDAVQPTDWDGKILVPFCFEAELSGVNCEIRGDQWMWYHRSFEVPNDWKGRRIWLNFEASDWETVVYANSQQVGIHRGGYFPFSIDITDHLKPSGPQELVVRVWDHSSREAFCSGGKQGRRGQLVYENCSGIWQTVWLEPRATGAVTSINLKGSLKNATVSVRLNTDGQTPLGTEARVELLDAGKLVATETAPFDTGITVTVPNPKAWEPGSPFLYDLRITLLKDGQVFDSIGSYCGLRDIWIDKTLEGPQIVLNGNPFFHFGPLDQGYWPLSVFTPPTEQALLYELDYIKNTGCNMVRLHIKRNPSRWYYHCDRLGLLVWQDFIPNKEYKGRSPDDSELWKSEQLMLIDSLNNHPSVVKWIVFNESWGQHKTEEIVNWAQSLLPDHIVSAASGWTDVDHLGDIRDVHDYSRFPSTTMPQSEPNRVVVLGETGGFGVPVNGNNWQQMPEPRDPGTADGRVGLSDRRGGMEPVNSRADKDFVSDIKRPVYTVEGQLPHYQRYIETLRLEQAFGLSGAVYTQLTDMRHEQNGWLTFDRKVSKIPVKHMKAVHDTLYRPVQQRKSLVSAASAWRNEMGEAVKFPIKSKGPTAQPRSRRALNKAAGDVQTYTTRFNVAEVPQQAALNIFMDSQHGVDRWGYLLIYLDGKLIFDDASRHKKAEHRVTCVPLTADQTALLTTGRHELKIELADMLPINSLDLGLDVVVGE